MVPFWVPKYEVPYYNRDPKGDQNFENHLGEGCLEGPCAGGAREYTSLKSGTLTQKRTYLMATFGTEYSTTRMSYYYNVILL